MYFNEKFLHAVLSDVSIKYSNFPADICFSIDSRTIKPGELFVALPGAHVDGHDFVNDALKKGASGLLIAYDKQQVLPVLDRMTLKKKLVIVVPDTLKALCSLATAWRSQFDYPVIAVTGSVGKTSTKKMIENILSVAGKSYIASHGNQNTTIGVALNLLKMRSSHQAAIIEAGISKRDEMAILARMIKPTTAIITNVGHSHMEGLGSVADVALEKRAIFSHFTEGNIGIIDGDQPILANIGYIHPVIKCGTRTTNQVQARKIAIQNNRTSFILKLYKEKLPVVFENTHKGLISNALAATAAAHLLHIAPDDIVKGIQKPVVITGRFEQRKLKKSNGFMINDCYNANPESMKASLLAFQEIDTNAKKVVVLGDMLELGVNGPFWHRQIGRFLRKTPTLRHVVLVGQMVSWTKKTLPVRLKVDHVPSWQDAVDTLKEILQDESLVLVKGSFGMGLGNLVNQFTSFEKSDMQ